MERSLKGHLYYPQVQIAFVMKDKPLAVKIKTMIGHGFIHIKKNRESCVFSIGGISGLIRFVTIVNGHMRGGKIIALARLIQYLNTKAGLSLKLLPANVEPLNSNSWLAGYSDRDSSFQVRTSVNTQYPRIGLSFELSQAMLDNYGTSNLKLLRPIRLLFNCNVLSIRQHTRKPQYRVMTGSLASMQLVRNYFETHPLMSSKRLDFGDWCKIHDYIKAKTQLSNVNEILAIKAGINSKRKFFNWEHLT